MNIFKIFTFLKLESLFLRVFGIKKFENPSIEVLKVFRGNLGKAPMKVPEVISVLQYYKCKSSL